MTHFLQHAPDKASVPCQTDSSEMPEGLERVAHDLAAAHWIFANTMPENPHEYTLRREWTSDADFVRAVLFIREHGYRNLFEGHWYTQLDVDEHTYWTMGAPVEETILINRKRIALAVGGPTAPATG